MQRGMWGGGCSVVLMCNFANDYKGYFMIKDFYWLLVGRGKESSRISVKQGHIFEIELVR